MASSTRTAPLDESDFAGSRCRRATRFCYRNRRFVLGKGLAETSSFKQVHAPREVGLAGDMEMLIPKSINRLRLQGAGSRYVHGGASLQEVVIPVLQDQQEAPERRQPASRWTSCAAPARPSPPGSWRSPSTRPSRSPTRCSRARCGPASTPRTATLISDQHELTFDLTSRESPRAGAAGALRADQRRPMRPTARRSSCGWRSKYAGHVPLPRSTSRPAILLRRSFTSDFDF